MLIPSNRKTGHEAAVEQGLHPDMDYDALARELAADIYDYRCLSEDRHILVRLAARASRDIGLAMGGFIRRSRYDAIFSNGENVSIPLAALFTLVRRRPAHVLIAHRVSTGKKQPFLRRLHNQMDSMFVYATTQRMHAVSKLGIPADKVQFIPFHADHRFYHPADQPVERMICSAGLEWRDYPTLLAAVDGLDLKVNLAAASPWSKHKNETEQRKLPPNVTARRYEYGELRTLYAKAAAVVVPLYENDFQAGVTTLLEAMAMGKPVIVTRTEGQTDVVEDGVNGLYVPPGDVKALRSAILRVLNDTELAQKLGRAARRTIEERMTLDHWVQRIADSVRATAERKMRVGTPADHKE
jgi:glycosyltransferase involved in cell wall biosynthesis